MREQEVESLDMSVNFVLNIMIILNCDFQILAFSFSFENYSYTQFVCSSYQLYTLKNAGLFEPKFGSNVDKPKFWVKNATKKIYS